MAPKSKNDETKTVETTGHEWDGIQELNNPLPRWWLWTFYATIVFAIGYSVAYPAIPLISSSTGGVLGWSSRGLFTDEMSKVELARKGMGDLLVQTELSEVPDNADLMQFALAGGSSAFKVYCSQCHGAGASGGTIYPSLVDDDWIWGGKLDDIYTTLQHGIRFQTDDDTRVSEMPAFGRDEILDRDQISDVAWYVRQLSNQEADAEAAARGVEVYVDNCAACHGEDGAGGRDFGAPSLNDAIWLYGGTHDEIMAQVISPQQGVMPAWGHRISDMTVRQLALYVHSLGGGE